MNKQDLLDLLTLWKKKQAEKKLSDKLSALAESLTQSDIKVSNELEAVKVEFIQQLKELSESIDSQNKSIDNVSSSLAESLSAVRKELEDVSSNTTEAFSNSINELYKTLAIHKINTNDSLELIYTQLSSFIKQADAQSIVDGLALRVQGAIGDLTAIVNELVQRRVDIEGDETIEVEKEYKDGKTTFIYWFDSANGYWRNYFYGV